MVERNFNTHYIVVRYIIHTHTHTLTYFYIMNTTDWTVHDEH